MKHEQARAKRVNNSGLQQTETGQRVTNSIPAKGHVEYLAVVFTESAGFIRSLSIRSDLYKYLMTKKKRKNRESFA